MDEPQRLALIVEAVRYCQRVKKMGMPLSCYTKALREPVHFLWERREGKGKAGAAQFRSKGALGLRAGSHAVIYDHAIPFRYLQDELLRLSEVTRESVGKVLSRHCLVALVTREEHARLTKAGVGSKMPAGWDGVDPLARYAAAGIEVVANAKPSC